MISPEDIAQLFDAYRFFYPEEGNGFPVLAEQLKRYEADICSRRNFRWHVVADGLVIDPKEGKVLMIYHRVLQRWLHPGGHIEDSDEHPAQAARREIFEETGLRPAPVLDEQQAPLLLHIDSHIIPKNDAKKEPEHWHHALSFLFLADATLPLPGNLDDGIVGCRWIDMEEARQYAQTSAMLDKIELF